MKTLYIVALVLITFQLNSSELPLHEIPLETYSLFPYIANDTISSTTPREIRYKLTPDGIKNLITEGADVNYTYKMNSGTIQTPLSWCILKGDAYYQNHEKCVEQLLCLDADQNIPYLVCYKHLLSVPVEDQNVTITTLLLQYNPKPEAIQEALYQALANYKNHREYSPKNNDAILKLLVDASSATPQELAHLTRKAAKIGYYQAVEELLKKGADPDGALECITKIITNSLSNEKQSAPSVFLKIFVFLCRYQTGNPEDNKALEYIHEMEQALSVMKQIIENNHQKQ